MLKTCSLTVGYPDGTTAVEGLTVHVERGETVALVGANGAGKTSLLLSLAGLLPVRGGTVSIDGIGLDRTTAGDIRRRVGFVFQNPDDQLFMPEICEDIAFGPRNQGLCEAAVAERVDAVIAELGIGHLRHRSPLKLSGGEKRTAAIATVLSMDPALILLDEPTAFLDPKSRRALINTLRSLPQTKLIATHDLPFAAELCDRVLMLKNGKLFAEGTPGLLADAELMAACDMEAIGTGL